MKLEWLTYVIEIAKTGSFSQAAKNLYIAQPNLSRSIKQLENELGYQIFSRNSDGAIPTPLGFDLIEHARLVYAECQRITESGNRQNAVRRQRLRYACLHSRNTAFLPMIYQKYIDSPISSVCLDCTSLDDLIRLIVSVQIDLAFIETISSFIDATKSRLRNLDIEYHPYAQTKIYAAVGPQSPLYQKKSVLLKDLYPYAIISHADINGDNSTNYSVVLGIENHTRGSVKTNSPKLFNQLISETSAVGLVATPPSCFYKLCEYQDIRLVDISDCRIIVELAWIKLRRLPLSDLAFECLEYNLETYGPWPGLYDSSQK